MANDDLMRGPDEMDLPVMPDLSDADTTADEFGRLPGDEVMVDDSDYVEVEIMEASMTAIGTVSTEEFEGTQCAIGSAAVEGDASISASAIGIMSAGSVGLHQAGACVIVVDGDAAIEQGGAQLIVAQRVDMENAGACIMVSGEANVARSWVGLMAARNATISDDSRVIIDGRAALIIGGLLFGGLGLVALAVFLGARRMAARIPHLPSWAHTSAMQARLRHLHMPDLPKVPDMPKLPDMSAIADMIARLRHSA
jgi:hypothetical protein